MQHIVTLVENVRAVWLAPQVELEVVGESFNVAHLNGLLQEGKHHLGLSLVAWLTPDPHNLHDPNAVLVWLGGGEVGHLSREAAALWQPALISLGNYYGAPIACLAEVHGGDYPSVWLRVPADGPRVPRKEVRSRVAGHRTIEADRRMGIVGTQTEVGRKHGLSARTVGKILDAHGLREVIPVHLDGSSEPLNLPRGVADGYAVFDDYDTRVYWIAAKVDPLLEKGR